MKVYEGLLVQCEQQEMEVGELRKYEDLYCVLQEELREQNDRSQWSTIILNSLSKQFDL